MDASPAEGVDASTRRAATDRIGDRLTAVRGERGLTVSEIARLVGVSASAISQIERGTSRPSVATLFALARALNVPVDAFFDDDELETRPEVFESSSALRTVPPPQDAERLHPYFVRSGERATLEIKGGVRWERLTPTALEGLDFMELVYAPRAESDPELYRHPGIELVRLLEGRLHIFVGFERYELEPGDSIAFPSSIPHRYVNPTDDVARAVTVILRDALSALPSASSTMR